MNSKVVLGQYYNSNSWIHRLDPRTKIMCVILFMIGVFLIDSLYVLLGTLGGVIILILTTKIPFTKFLKSMQMMTFLLVFAFLCQVLFRKTGNLLHTFNFELNVINLIITIVLLIGFILLCNVMKKGKLLLFLSIVCLSFLLQTYMNYSYLIVSYKIEVYDDSLLSATFILVRITLLIFVSSILTYCTKPTELNIGLEWLLSPLRLFKVNVSILSMMIAIALRNIPTLINEANKILKAQASRGVDFSESKLKDKIMQIIALIIPMFIIAYQKAEDLSEAMEARGYDPSKKRTSINVLKFRFSDFISLIFINLLFIGLILYKVIW